MSRTKKEKSSCCPVLKKKENVKKYKKTPSKIPEKKVVTEKKIPKKVSKKKVSEKSFETR